MLLGTIALIIALTLVLAEIVVMLATIGSVLTAVEIAGATGIAGIWAENYFIRQILTARIAAIEAQGGLFSGQQLVGAIGDALLAEGYTATEVWAMVGTLFGGVGLR